MASLKIDSLPVTAQITEKGGLPTSSNESPPPSYTVNDENPIPDITAAFANLRLGSSGKPTSDQCIAHLKLLEAFHQLREDVATQDGLFGIQDDFVPSTLDDRQRANLLAKIREKRWAVYVAKAAERFRCWWDSIIEPNARKLKQKDIPMVFKQQNQIGQTSKFDKESLPPLGTSYPTHTFSIGLSIGLTDFHRRYNGLACLSVEPTRFSRGLSTIWQIEILEVWPALGSH